MNIKNHSETLKNKDYRLDSEFHQSPPPDNSTYKYVVIGDILLSSQYGISIKMNEENDGYPIYRMNEIHNMLTDLELLKYANVNKDEAGKYLLNNRDVLFNRTNSQKFVGRTGLHRKLKNEKKIFASYLIRLNPDPEKVLPEYLTAFLNSKTGIWDIKRRARISINQSNVNAEEVKAIRIPLVSRDLQYAIKKRFDEAHEKRINSIRVYEEANTSLANHMGLKDFGFGKNNTNTKSFSSSFQTSGRLDAEYYLPKFEQIVSKITSQSYGRLEDLTEIIKSIEPGTANYSGEGIPFMRVADYDKFGINKYEVCIKDNYCKENEEKIEKLKLKKDTILLSKDGSVGIAYTVREDREMLTSSAILHLKIKDEVKLLPEYLALVLNSKLTQMQAERDGGGSIILHWRMGDVKNVLIPVIDFEKQKEINELVKKSFKLKKQSENLLETAKRAVEIAIEEDEEAAFDYIDEHSSALLR